MNPNDHKTKFNFNSNQPSGNGIFGSSASNTNNGSPASTFFPRQPQTTSTLNVPVLSPTHFDEPTQPLPPQPVQLSPEELEKQKLQKSAKTSKVLAIVFGVLTALCLILAIVGFVLNANTSNELAKSRQLVSSQSAIIAAVESSAGTTISSPADVPTYQTTHGYIYLDDWNIKLKVPEDLTSVSYIYDQKYRPSICFNGLKKGVQYFPAFADIAQNTGGMGCLVRVETSEGNADQDGRSFGTLVFTDNNGYNYFYVAPSRVFSTDAAEQGLEQTAVQLIKTMLSGNNISIYD